VVKAEFRQKLLTESLLLLQKTIKTKKVVHPLKQRVVLTSCLYVIDSLVSYDTAGAGKLAVVARENYYNSIRTLCVRDGSASQTIPQSFVKIANELLTDTLDLTSKLNSEIIRKSISILKVLSDFISTQRKKLKIQENEKKAAAANLNIPAAALNEEQKENNMEMQIEQ
jgi:hypothetical protein